MIIAGARLTNTEVALLASKLRDADMADGADRVEHAYENGDRLFSLSADERTAFYEALNECPPPLFPLRAGLSEQLG